VARLDLPALVLLVIACPCALVISTPVTIVSGLAAAARRGILVKGGVYLEQGRTLSWLALDKTGTITHGKPVQTDFDLHAEHADAAQVHRLGASLAARSDHPVSQAIAAAARDASAAAFDEVTDFEALAGRGVRGTIGGARYWLGNHRLVEELERCSPALEAKLDVLERQGKSVVMLIDEARVLGIFAVADTIKETSRAAIADLHALGIRTAMLTGDNPHTAQAIAQQAGIDDARGNQLPEDKLAAVEELSARGAGAVGMVGDGINDAPALARRYRLRDGRDGHRHGDRDGRRRVDGRRPAQDSRVRAAVAGDAPRAGAEHRLRARREDRVPRSHDRRARHDVDGRVRGRRREPDRRRQRVAAAVEGRCVRRRTQR
jgi:Cd2+/Zn2+-exporting ATPase